MEKVGCFLEGFFYFIGDVPDLGLARVCLQVRYVYQSNHAADCSGAFYAAQFVFVACAHLIEAHYYFLVFH